MDAKMPGVSASSAAPQYPSEPSQRNSATRLFAVCCLVLAEAGAVYLAIRSLLGGGIAGCEAQSGCNTVISSRWGYWLGMPVSVPAAALYLGLLVIALRSGAERSGSVRSRKLLWTGMTAGSVAVIGAVAWFILLQSLVIKAWCKFCLGTHAAATLGALALLTLSWKRRREGVAGAEAPPRGHYWNTSVVAGCVGLAMLIGGQVLVKARLFGVTGGLGSAWSARSIALHGGQFRLDPDSLPGIGSAAATNYIVSLFDYTCSHCRALHAVCKRAEQDYTGRIRIITLPAPLDSACNSLILFTASANNDACEYAKVGLAVWRVRPEAFAEFQDWAMGSAKVPSLQEMRGRAEALVGKEAFQRALNSSWVARQLETDVALYQANAKAVRDVRLPQLMIGQVILHGAIDDVAELEKYIEVNR